MEGGRGGRRGAGAGGGGRGGGGKGGGVTKSRYKAGRAPSKD